MLAHIAAIRACQQGMSWNDPYALQTIHLSLWFPLRQSLGYICRWMAMEAAWTRRLTAARRVCFRAFPRSGESFKSPATCTTWLSSTRKTSAKRERARPSATPRVSRVSRGAFWDPKGSEGELWVQVGIGWEWDGQINGLKLDPG